MDLSWCIICDNRIMEDDSSMSDSENTPLYCSEECRIKDENSTTAALTEQSSPSSLSLFSSSSPSPSSSFTFTAAKPTLSKKAAKYQMYKTTAPAAHYPWIPLFRKRHNNSLLQLKRCCQPTVAGSPATAAGVLSSLIR